MHGECVCVRIHAYISMHLCALMYTWPMSRTHYPKIERGLGLVVHIPSGCVAKNKYPVTVTVTVTVTVN